MAIANALNAENGVVCTHEGKFRHGDASGRQLLPFLTLENRVAYETPGEAKELFIRTRSGLEDRATESGYVHLGDIAYNYAPFIGSMTNLYPAAKLIVLFRNGIDFVRSATLLNGEDTTPIGWPPVGKPLSAVERFVGLGRLCPRQNDPLAERWTSLDHIARNAWLWAETNRLILDGIAGRTKESTLVIRFEEFFEDPVAHYRKLVEFLGIEGGLSEAAMQTFKTPINRRPVKVVDSYDDWTEPQRRDFLEIAGSMMTTLGYDSPLQRT